MRYESVCRQVTRPEQFHIMNSKTVVTRSTWHQLWLLLPTAFSVQVGVGGLGELIDVQCCQFVYCH